MLYAMLNGEKIEASTGLKAQCPLCEKDVFARCGGTNANHWAHYEEESCESWSEPETEWHKNWKLVFGKENSEIIIEKDGKRHIADVLTSNHFVIEFQHSPISIITIENREKFYGEKMLWVINGVSFKDHFTTYYNPEERSGRRIYVGHSSQQESNWELDNDKDIRFEWKQPRRVWIGADKPRFIDFGGAYLFKIRDWSGQRFGGGVWISKKNFVEEHDGDKKLLSSQSI